MLGISVSQELVYQQWRKRTQHTYDSLNKGQI